MATLFHDRTTSRRIALGSLVVVALPIFATLNAFSADARLAAAAESARSAPAAAEAYAGSGPLHGLLSPAGANSAPHGPFADQAAALPFQFSGSKNARGQAVTCLAAAAWYEAGNDPEGQRSVIQVVLNRVKHPSFPKTVCGVVFQGSDRATGCQFTFTCDGSLQRRRPSAASWELARQTAESGLAGAVDKTVRQATHYHADYVSPWWSGQLERLAQIGRHIFYRWPGARGTLSSGTRTASPEGDTYLARLGVDESGALMARPTESDLAETANVTITAAPVAFAETTAPAQPASALGRPPVAGGAIIMTVDNDKPSGRWALDALGQCSDGKGCQILGYADAAQAARNSGLPGRQRDRPLFIFARDGSSSMMLALWDCEKVQRPDRSQCLPDDTNELKALMQGPTVS
ncbi:MAG: cell wall hydrolase [Sphingomonadales bacterium]|nr:cell wall hydrolase [Sphingomonadales bacterium]MBU3993856.1 cell wall hydrolase [Alphaproteobacteria bacterium]